MLLTVAVPFQLAACGPNAGPVIAPDSGRAVFEWVEYAGADPVFEQVPPPGAFRNPILAGFHPDPSIERVGDDYYLVNSTFGFYPGVPVFHSRDMVNWTQIGNAIDRPDMMPFGPDVSLSGGGIYAPAIRHHDGTFYLTTTCVGCGGNFILTTRDPAQGWSDPVWLPHIGGIDPSPFFDDDGRMYIVHHADPPVKKYPAHTQIRIMEVDRKTFAPLSEDVLLVDGSDKQPWHTDYIEGPHLYKVDGRYYLGVAGGGTGYYHQQLFYRADSPFGPFRANPRNPVLTQFGLPDDRPDPVTATGHADLVQDQNGRWWAVFLGTRVYDLATPPQDPGNFHTGRETFLLPVRWEDGWPVMLAKGQPLPWTPKAPALPAGDAPAVPTTGNFGWREEFDAPALPPQWLFARTPRSQWWSTGSGALVLQPRADRIGGNGQPSFVGRRIQHMKASFSTRLKFSPSRPGDEAGLLAVQNDDFYYAFGLGTDEQGNAVLRVHRRRGGDEPADGVVLAERALGPEVREGVTLKIDIDRARIDFRYSADDETFTALLDDADADVLTTAAAGGFVGAVVGPYAHKEASP
nr:glycoside hydrolase family 43 protein [Lysobacter chinensis]